MQLTVNQTSLQTCDPLVMDISGGQKPYKVMIAAVNSSVTNATMGANDDEYTWIDTADPGSPLVVGMSLCYLVKKR